MRPEIILRAGRLLLFVGFALSLSACVGGSAGGLTPTDASNSRATIGETSNNLQVVRDLPAPANVLVGNAQKIFQNDLLEIDVFQVDQLDTVVRVDSRGNISLPLIGTVKAEDLSVPELESLLEARYGANYLQSPDITVLVKESTGQTVTMDGEFRKTGTYPITSQATLLRMVAVAGGLSDLGDENKLFVYRAFPSGNKVAQYSVADIRAGKQRDPVLYGGDVVVSFTSQSKIAARNLREALGLASSAARVAAPF